MGEVERSSGTRGSAEEWLAVTKLSRHIDFCSAQSHLPSLTSNPD